MFLIGALGFFHEVLLTGQERPFLITACLALMGLPFVLSADNKYRKNGTKEDE